MVDRSPRVGRCWRASRGRSGSRSSGIAYPADIARFAQEDPPRAREIQQKPTAASSATPSSSGLAVTGFERGDSRGRLTYWSHGNENRPDHSAPDPHAAGAFLRDQLRPHLRARTSSWWKCRAKALSGWGEVTGGENPFYNEEWTDSAWMILRDYVAPRVLGPRIRIAPRTWPR